MHNGEGGEREKREKELDLNSCNSCKCMYSCPWLGSFSQRLGHTEGSVFRLRTTSPSHSSLSLSHSFTYPPGGWLIMMILKLEIRRWYEEPPLIPPTLSVLLREIPLDNGLSTSTASRGDTKGSLAHLSLDIEAWSWDTKQGRRRSIDGDDPLTWRCALRVSHLFLGGDNQDSLPRYAFGGEVKGAFPLSSSDPLFPVSSCHFWIYQFYLLSSFGRCRLFSVLLSSSFMIYRLRNQMNTQHETSASQQFSDIVLSNDNTTDQSR